MKTRTRSVMSFVITTALLLGSSAFGQQKSRVEKDLLGQQEIPADACYGVQTARALEIIREKPILTEAQIKDLLDPAKLTGLDRSRYKKK